MSKNLLLFKRIDFWLQISIFFGGIIFACVSFIFYIYQSGNYLIFNTLYFYFALGFVQFLSTLIHLFNFKKINFLHSFRQFYSLIIFVIVFFSSLLYFQIFSFNLQIIWYSVMIFISPILALFYLWITWQELQILEKISLEK